MKIIVLIRKVTRKIIFFSPSSYTLPFDSFSGGTLERADCPVRAGCRPGGRRGKRSKPCTHCRPQPTNLFVRPDPLLLFTYFLFDLPTEPTSGPIVRSVPIGPELLGPGAGPEAGAQRSLETVESDRSRTHSRPRPTNLFVRPCTRARAVTSKIDPRTWVGGRIGLRPRSRHCRYAAW